MTKHDPRPIADHASLPGEHPSGEANSAVAVRYLFRREPRPDRSPRSQRSFAPSPTYGKSASSGALNSARDLAMMAAARSRDPPRADLAALGDEPAQRRNVLVVDLADLVPAVRAGLAPTRASPSFVSRRGRAGRLRCFANRASCDSVGVLRYATGQTNVRSDRPADRNNKSRRATNPKTYRSGRDVTGP
jgi:hypothetical protein